MSSGTNLPAVASYNQVVILDAIRRAPAGISRTELAAATGLSAMTASNVCRRLLADGFIHETGTKISGVGKPRQILELRPNARFAVGIHLDPSVISVVLLDLAGGVVAHESRPTPLSAEHTVEEMASAVAALVEETGVPFDRIMGAGIAAPGPMDKVSGTLVNPPLLVGWESVPIRDLLAARLRMPVLLEKDVAAAAIAETWAGPNSGSFIFLYYGTGIGAGFAIGNDVVRGASGNSGDVGSLALSSDSGATPGRQRLGEAVLPSNVVRRAIEHGVLRRAPEMSGTSAVQEAFAELAQLGVDAHPGALSIIDEIAADLAEGLVSVINLLDADRVVFGGPFWYPMSPLLLDRIPRLVSASPNLVPPHGIIFVEATVGQDVAAMGAACVVLDREFSPRSSTMLISRGAS